MQDLSLHVLDIAENSTRAGATLVEIKIVEDIEANQLRLIIKDNGKGIEKEQLKSVQNPFYTTRTTRRVGLGIPLLKQNCERTGGTLILDSQVGIGTCLRATMQYAHIDRLPIGNMVSTLMTLIRAHPDIDWVYTHQKEDKSIKLDTREIKEILKEVPINQPEVLQWLKHYILEQYNIFN